MNTNYRRRWRIIRSFVLGWTIAFIFLTIVRGSGTIEAGSVQFELSRSIAVSFLLGTIFGGLAGCAQILIEERLYRRVSLSSLLIMRFVFAVASLAALILFSYVMVTTFFGITVGLAEFIIEPGSFAIYLYILSTDFFMVYTRYVNLLFGEGNLWLLLRGKFYNPRVEERIFMFLDLQSSTTLAEEMGHVKYSMFIQDCFEDLGVVADNEANVYQYVGDGVILTWRVKDGLRNQNCLNAFFNFKNRLTSRSDYYLKTYDRQPVFTAGINAGTVTVTEVGKHKKEIAYHGDTLNTAARIQSKCKTFGRDFLITDNLRSQLKSDGVKFAELGRIALRGKEEEVAVFAVEMGAGVDEAD